MFRRYLCLLIVFVVYATMSKLAVGEYTVELSQPKQTILGIGVEIQSDSIGSGNNGLPNSTNSVPHDLIASEKKRFYSEMMSGFRYVRLAMGLFFRGLDEERKQIIERFPGQVSELSEMVKASGVEGFDFEYWSPAPYWKSSKGFIGGTLASNSTEFLSSFAQAVIKDIVYLEKNGCPVVMFGLQNEPDFGTGHICGYSCCEYTKSMYSSAFKHVAPAVKSYKDAIFIHVDSWGGQSSQPEIANNPEMLKYVDGWTWHKIGANSDLQITDQAHFLANSKGKPVFSNEYEYFEFKNESFKTVNTAQSIMNWFVFENSPTWFWLHALKPTTNSESAGYGLGFWRPPSDKNFTHFPNLKVGHFETNPVNWHGVKGFSKLIPWNSVRYAVTEAKMSMDQRILAVKSPSGKLIVVITNRWTEHDFTFQINTGTDATFSGIQYNATHADVLLDALNGPYIEPVVPPLSIQFWIQQ